MVAGAIARRPVRKAWEQSRGMTVSFTLLLAVEQCEDEEIVLNEHEQAMVEGERLYGGPKVEGRRIGAR